MPARFRVSRTFLISQQQLFVLAGDIVEGAVSPGMQFEIPVGAAPSLVFRVHSVEFVDRMRPSESKVALTVKCDSAGMLDVLLASDLREKEIDVRDQEG